MSRDMPFVELAHILGGIRFIHAQDLGQFLCGHRFLPVGQIDRPVETRHHRGLDQTLVVAIAPFRAIQKVE